MSKTTVDNVSDDEFQDALSEVPNTNSKTQNEKTSEAIIDEIIEQQTNMSLKDDDGDEDYKDASEKPPVLNEKDAKDTVKMEYMEEMIIDEELEELEKSMSAEQLQANKEKSDRMKLEANELFKNDKAYEAIEIYTEAIKLCPVKNRKERGILYGNRAAAKIKIDLKKSALDDCTKAIELYPDYVRALLRRAKLYEYEDKLDEALTDYKRVYELDPGQPEAREACVRLPPIVNERNEQLKAECLDKLKELGNLILKPFGLSTANFQMQQDPESGGYSINFNQNAS